MRRDSFGNFKGSQEVSGQNTVEVVPLERFEAFLRQLSHDVRNDLNAMDLLTSYVEDIQSDGNVREALAQLHDSVRYGSHRMQRLSRAVQRCEPDCIPYPSDLLFEDLRERFNLDRPEWLERVQWERVGERVVVPVDAGLVMEALLELLGNALGFSPVDSVVRVICLGTEAGALWRIEQAVDKAPDGMERWGRIPLETTRRSHYGLGLFRVRRIVGVHHARLNFSHEAGSQVLVTELLLKKNLS